MWGFIVCGGIADLNGFLGGSVAADSRCSIPVRNISIPEDRVRKLTQAQLDAIAKSRNFNTALNPYQEAAFQVWKLRYAPQDSGYDYDLRGAFAAGLTPDPKSGHWPDTFKKPNHPTFSVESRYAQGPWKVLAGSWDGETYIPAGSKPKPAFRPFLGGPRK